MVDLAGTRRTRISWNREGHESYGGRKQTECVNIIKKQLDINVAFRVKVPMKSLGSEINKIPVTKSRSWLKTMYSCIKYRQSKEAKTSPRWVEGLRFNDKNDGVRSRREASRQALI